VLRTPGERLLTGKRGLWLVVVVLGGLVGAVAYLGAGRRPPPAANTARTAGASPADRGRRAADLLYGKPKVREDGSGPAKPS